MRYDRIRRVLVVVVAGLIFLPAALFSQQSPSQGRSARVSYVSGKVTVNRPDAPAGVPAKVNMPLEEGVELSTGSGGYAAVGLENGSTIQMNGLTKARFTQLSTDADGNRLTLLTLEKGYFEFHFVPDHQNVYKVKVADATVTPTGKSQFHIGYISGKVNMYVSMGSVTVSAHANSISVGKGKVMEYTPSANSQVAKSHVRVVRLSYVSGTVTIKRTGSGEEEKAIVNTPIQEGFELSTSGGSYAEVEFENGSTARLGELSKLLFNSLALDAEGNKLNGMIFDQGYATFHFVPEYNSSAKQHTVDGVIHFEPKYSDAYHVMLADATVTAQGKCEFRTDLDQEHFRVEVFSGYVEVATTTLSSELGAGKVLEHTLGTSELAANNQKGIVKDAWDQWTEARDKQAQLTAMDEAVHAYGPSYGWGDLNTYGEWVQLPNGRIVWAPYVGAGWAPYTLGQWGYYGGLGWTWISGEPWGWMPYHCGMWDFDFDMGWYWMPPMYGCGLWEPMLVTWYGGPGWIGWAPNGMPTSPFTGPASGRPHAGPPLHPPRGIVRVPTTVVQNSEMITPPSVNKMPFTGGSIVGHPPLEPSPRPVTTTGALPPGGGISIEDHGPIANAPPASGANGAGFGPHHDSAPPTILMGGDPAKEGLLLTEHGLHFGHAPLRAAEGTTLGGRYALHGSAGEFRGEGGRGGSAGGRGGLAGGPVLPSSSGRSGGPVFASHGSNGGGFAVSSGGHSGGGGFSGGASGGHTGGGGGGLPAGGGSTTVSGGGGAVHH